MVSAVSSASGATRYYERDGYYANDDPEHRKGSFWHGKAAEELGLSKQVDPADFHHVLEGHVPDSDIRLGRVRDGEHQHFTFKGFHLLRRLTCDPRSHAGINLGSLYPIIQSGSGAANL